MLVRDVMTSPAITVRDTAAVKDATILLDRHAIAALPVVDHDGRLVGVVSEADVIRDLVLPDQRVRENLVTMDDQPRVSRVVDVMSAHVLTATSDTELAEAVELITSTAVKSLPVVDAGRLVGMVSRRDVVHQLARADEVIEAQVDDLVRQVGRDWLVDVADGIVAIDGTEDEADRRLARALAGSVAGVVGVRFESSRVPAEHR